MTHLAAPGFAFMMGLGIILFSQSRLRIGWSTNKLLKHDIIRGLILIVLNPYNIAMQAFVRLRCKFLFLFYYFIYFFPQ